MTTILFEEPKKLPMYHKGVFDVELHPSIPISKITLICTIIKELDRAITDGFWNYKNVMDLIFEQKYLLAFLTLPYDDSQWCRLVNNSLKQLTNYHGYDSLDLSAFVKTVSIKQI